MRWIALMAAVIIVALLLWPALVFGWKGSKKTMTSIMQDEEKDDQAKH
jgi:hypothetical protein